MDILTTEAQVRAWRRQWNHVDDRVVLVPTMGALHEGHASLCRMAKQSGNRVVVSIFVNPMQFGANEDLTRYPRPKEADLALCAELGVDAVFYPTIEILYPNGVDNATRVIPPASLTERLCGANRPGHFTGVATVVLALFNLIQPHAAIFGEKDAQQLAVIRRMVQDLHVPIEIIGHPIVREGNGLALSSRNRYIETEAQQQTAKLLFQLLSAIRNEVVRSQHPLPTTETIQRVMTTIVPHDVPTGVKFSVQYLEAVDPQTFHPAETLKPGVLLLMAAFVDEVRLIDNLLIE
jgi:pantoate--beta-alanine ligase